MAAVDIYVNETTRHADVILPPTTALERDHYDLVFHALAVRNTARFTPAVLRKADGRAATTGRSTASSRCARRPGCDRRPAPRRRLAAAGPARDQPDPAGRPACSRTRAHGCRCGSCARTPRASTSARCGPTMPERLQTQDQADRPRRRTWSLGDLARLRASLADTAQPAADELLLDRAAPPARQQLLDAQHRAADPGPAAPPAADAPRRPRRPRASRTAPGSRSPRGSARSRSRCRRPRT